MPAFEDLTGRQFGYLYVVGRVPDSEKKLLASKSSQFYCRCVCGQVINVVANSLKSKNTTSCGCMAKKTRAHANLKHGLAAKKGGKRDFIYDMYISAKYRAKKRGLLFTLQLTDLQIPTTCPVLGIPIFRTGTKAGPNSPSLDRSDNAKGYTKENVRVISNRANTLKNNATLEEFRSLVAYLESLDRMN